MECGRIGVHEKGDSMSDLDLRFEAAASDVQQLPERPDNAALLKLYALYKQGTKGDVGGERPGRLAFADRAKYDAWAELAGISPDDAKQGYIDLVEELKAG
jgi:acyl-CoA-binding protein